MEKVILNMFEKKNKRIKTDLYLQIYSIEDFYPNDELEINLREGCILYKGIFLIKGEIFPTPKESNILNIKELYLDYDNNLYLKLYISAEIKQDYININNQSIINKENKEISLLSNNLFNFVKERLNLKDDYSSSVFIVKETTKDFYILMNFRDLKEYKLQKNSIYNFRKDCLILINYYKNNNYTIITDLLSIIKLLKEEELFNIIYRYIDSNISGIFKVIDIESNYLILVDKLKRFYKLDKSKFNLNFGQLIIIANYKLENIENENFKLINISNNSFTFTSSQNIYFKDLSINRISPIKFYIKDFNTINQYNKIVIENSVKEIVKDEFFFVLETYINIYEYINIEISLIHSNNSKFNKTFNFVLYRGFLNKINLLINNISEESYLYEYIYIDLSKDINNINEIIHIKDNEKYEFNIYDSFNSKNRRRINIMNVPKQKILNEKKEEILFSKDKNTSNSIQICKCINNSTMKILGIFNINEIKLNANEMNNIFDNYYDEFGDIFNKLIENEETFDLKDFVNKCISKYNECNLNKRNSHLLSYFEDKITLSQYKTRLGYLICYYFNLNKDKKSFENEFMLILNQINIQIKKKKITLFQKLRIFFFYLREFSISAGYHNLKLIFFEDYSPNNPYALGNNLNIEEIKNLSEYSRLFFPYLQIDSHILFNYYINETSYSYTLEPLFIMKYNLLINYEEFFFVTRIDSDKYAYITDDERITVINEKTLFKREINDDNVVDIEEIEESKRYALSISMEFRHEKNCHEKKQQKNGIKNSPVFFSRDLKYEKIEIKIDGKRKGESGRIVESFIIPDLKKIKRLKVGLIYGELLDYKYYIQKDFKDLIIKMNEIDNRENKKMEVKNIYKDECKTYDNIIIDEDNISKKEKVKNINNIIKAYEKIGFVVEGDRIYSKASRESVRFYKSSDFLKEQKEKLGKEKK